MNETWVRMFGTRKKATLRRYKRICTHPGAMGHKRQHTILLGSRTCTDLCSSTTLIIPSTFNICVKCTRCVLGRCTAFALLRITDGSLDMVICRAYLWSQIGSAATTCASCLQKGETRARHWSTGSSHSLCQKFCRSFVVCICLFDAFSLNPTSFSPRTLSKTLPTETFTSDMSWWLCCPSLLDLRMFSPQARCRRPPPTSASPAPSLSSSTVSLHLRGRVGQQKPG